MIKSDLLLLYHIWEGIIFTYGLQYVLNGINYDTFTGKAAHLNLGFSHSVRKPFYKKRNFFLAV